MLLLSATVLAASAWAQESAATDPLHHSKWKLNPGQGGRTSTLVFDEGSFNLTSCNLTSGKYAVSGDRIVVAGPVRSTKRACLENSEATETALMKLLTENVSFSVSGDKLTLVGPGKSRYTFIRASLPPKDAVTRFIYVAPAMVDCPGASPSAPKCLQIREDKTAPWDTYNGKIVDFTPVPGIAYRLRVKEEKIANPPAGEPDRLYFLDLVVEQTVVDREAADAFHKGLPPPPPKK